MSERSMVTNKLDLLVLLSGTGVSLLLFYYLLKVVGSDTKKFKLSKVGYSPPTSKVDDLNEFWAGDLPPEAKDVIQILVYPHYFARHGAQIPKGILLVGPPGTGKTHFVRTLVSLTNSNYFYASASEFDEIFVGRGPQRVRNLFEEAYSATQPSSTLRLWLHNLFRIGNPKQHHSRSIIFIDEIDAIGVRSNPLQHQAHATVSELLTRMDGLLPSQNVLVIAATNSLNSLDSALLRSGRFDRIIKLSLPSQSSREKMIQFYLRKRDLSVLSLEIIKKFAKLSEGFNCADIINFVNESCLLASRHYIESLEKTDLTMPQPADQTPTFSIEDFIGGHLNVVRKIKSENQRSSLRINDHTLPRLMNFSESNDHVNLVPEHVLENGYREIREIFSEQKPD